MKNKNICKECKNRVSVPVSLGMKALNKLLQDIKKSREGYISKEENEKELSNFKSEVSRKIDE